MARETDTGLLTPAPTRVAAAHLQIIHLQLRDLLACPRRPGLVNYISDKKIIEHDLSSSEPPRTLVQLEWNPNSLAAYALPDSDIVVLAAGGQDAELHLSAHAPDAADALWADPPGQRIGGSINNAVAFAPPGPGCAEPTLVVNNNDASVQLFDVALRKGAGARLRLRTRVAFPTPVNHSSISPDGRTLLSVGDSAAVFLHALPAAQPVLTLAMPPAPPPYAAAGPPASFATAFSPSGAKFAVGGQDGVLVVWDVRSSKPLKVINPSRRAPLSDALREGGRATGTATGWVRDVLGDSVVSSAPPWGVRSIKFGADVLLFTEHTSRIHAIDARTFDTHDVYPMPPAPGRRSRSVESGSASPPPPPARDLAGCCFSPDGARAYAASERCVAEWGVRGAGRWWERGADAGAGVLA